MGKIIIGSARIDESGHLTGGRAGDQKQASVPDYKGEVSLQTFYNHKKGWYILRPKDKGIVAKLGTAMMTACNNGNIGYDQNNRLDIMKKGIRTTSKAECDCSSLVRACILDASGKDVGNFTTSTECTILEVSGLFEKRKAYKNGMALYTGDVLCTKTKGHTVIVVQGNNNNKVETQSDEYYPQYKGNSDSIVDALISLNINASKENRKKIAAANGISDYSGTAKQNMQMFSLLKQGRLKRI